MKKGIKWVCGLSVILALLLLSACRNQELEHALTVAGDHGAELEKVLAHYKNDKQKYEAASFLISNMPGHSRYDSQAVKRLQVYYDKCCDISEKYNWERTDEWRDETNAYWEEVKGEALPSLPSVRSDIRSLKADILIREIDLAFKAWKENAYSRSVGFDEFCRYILPYRIHNVICMDNSRSIFYQRHAGWFDNNKVDFRIKIDSLLYRYRHLTHNDFAAASLPLLSLGAFEQMKKGLCDDRCKFNVALLSSLGMPVAQDFVPAWGNRSGGHSWNVIVLDGTAYPFEAFWDEDRWKYKKIYNNESLDLKWGKFRLPKVFRVTYEPHLEGPLKNEKVKTGEVPPLFLNPWKEDVSDQYFQAVDVQLKITKEIPKEAKYCYLCVFDHNGWMPVQWGEIENDYNVTFRKMGKDIIYLPAFYQNGNIIPAADPFLLDQNGQCRSYKMMKKRQDIVTRRVKPFLDAKEIANEKKWLVGACLYGCERPEVTGEKLYEWTDSLDMWNNKVAISASRPYRYYRLVSASDSIALCELSFRVMKEDGLKDVSPLIESGEVRGVKKGEKINMMFDHLTTTGFKGIFCSKQKAGVLCDLGSPYLLREISYTPYSDTGIKKGEDYKLYYWDDEWVSVAKMVGENDLLVFKNVPMGTIYWVDTPHLAEQIFLYENGILEWR